MRGRPDRPWSRLPVPLLLLAGCGTPDAANFLHRGHRERYVLAEAELRSLPCYISRRVVAYRRWIGGDAAKATGGFVIREEVAGTILAVGPDWLRVRFGEEGTGVFFVTDPAKSEDLYWLATEVPGSEGLQMLRTLPEKTLLFQGDAYEIVEGDDAFLRVHRSRLEDILEDEDRIPGRRAPASRPSPH